MSRSYSANQYDSAFKSQKLQNWTVPKQLRNRPSAAEGHTTFISTDRGHLLPHIKPKSGSAWPSFQGTWDLPNHFAPVYINPTARSREGMDRLSTRGKTRSATGQNPKASGGSLATSRISRNMENVNQPGEEFKTPVSNTNQDEPEHHTEKPRANSQQNQAQSRPTSQHIHSQQANQVHSRPAS